MVDVARHALVTAPHSDCAVIRTSHELLAGRREFNVHNRRNVALLDILRLGEVPGVEEVDVVIFRGNSHVHRLHGVEDNAVGGELENSLDDRHVGAQIEQNDRAICADGTHDRGLNLVEANIGDGVAVVRPLYRLRSRAVLQIPNTNAAGTRRGDEGVGGAMERESRVWTTFLPCRKWRWRVGLGVRIPKLDAVSGTCEELLVVGEGHSLDDVVVGGGLPCFIPCCEIPDLDDTITGTGSDCV